MALQLQELKMKKMAQMELLLLMKKNYAKGVCEKNFVKTPNLREIKFVFFFLGWMMRPNWLLMPEHVLEFWQSIPCPGTLRFQTLV